MCLYPKLIKNRKYIANKKNGGVIPAVSDKRLLWVPRKCGKCMECKKQQARDTQMRLSEHIRHKKNGVFVTLTFSNESIKYLGKLCDKLEGYDRDNQIATLAMHRFRERWRKKYNISPEHWFVTELGHEGTENIHMHGIIWTDENVNEIDRIWKSGEDGGGFTWIGDEKKGGWVNEQTVNYIVKYIHKTDLDHKEYNPKILSSPGLGKGYMDRIDHIYNKYKPGKTKETYTNRQGYQVALPTYLRNKIYTEEEREKLWLEKLDKQERYVNGIKVSIKDGEERYYKMLEEARRISKKLGYGDDEINWDRKQYENDRRNINYKLRTEQREIDETLYREIIADEDELKIKRRKEINYPEGDVNKEEEIRYNENDDIW